MIITRGYAKQLVRQGKATEDGSTYDLDRAWQIVTRHDLQRVDHYRIDDRPTPEVICPGCGLVNEMANDDGAVDGPREYHVQCWIDTI